MKEQEPRNTNSRGRFHTVDLLIKVDYCVSKVYNIFNIKSSRSKLVRTRSTVLRLPLQLSFPAEAKGGVLGEGVGARLLKETGRLGQEIRYSF